MGEAASRFSSMFVHGINSIGFTTRHDYKKHVPEKAGHEAMKRWINLGNRFRDSANKVVGTYER